MLKQLFTEVEVARGKYPPLKTESLQAASKTNVKISHKLRKLSKYNSTACFVSGIFSFGVQGE